MTIWKHNYKIIFDYIPLTHFYNFSTRKTRDVCKDSSNVTIYISVMEKTYNNKWGDICLQTYSWKRFIMCSGNSV